MKIFNGEGSDRNCFFRSKGDYNFCFNELSKEKELKNQNKRNALWRLQSEQTAKLLL